MPRGGGIIDQQFTALILMAWSDISKRQLFNPDYKDSVNRVSARRLTKTAVSTGFFAVQPVNCYILHCKRLQYDGYMSRSNGNQQRADLLRCHARIECFLFDGIAHLKTPCNTGRYCVIGCDCLISAVHHAGYIRSLDYRRIPTSLLVG
jgi:hypothetical protein